MKKGKVFKKQTTWNRGSITFLQLTICSAESLCDVRWMLTNTNVEIIHSIFTFGRSHFLTKVIFSNPTAPIDFKIGVKCATQFWKNQFRNKAVHKKFNFSKGIAIPFSEKDVYHLFQDSNNFLVWDLGSLHKMFSRSG